MDEKKILSKIDEYCVTDGTRKLLACATAFEMAKELNVDISAIGRLCNQESIKLSSCQLGCFNGSK